MERKTTGPNELQELLVVAGVRLAELIEVCTEQQEHGILQVEQPAFVRAQRVLDEIGILEEMMRPNPS